MVHTHTRHPVGVKIFPSDTHNPPQKVHNLVSSINFWPKLKMLDLIWVPRDYKCTKKFVIIEEQKVSLGGDTLYV